MRHEEWLSLTSHSSIIKGGQKRLIAGYVYEKSSTVLHSLSCDYQETDKKQGITPIPNQ